MEPPRLLDLFELGGEGLAGSQVKSAFGFGQDLAEFRVNPVAFRSMSQVFRLPDQQYKPGQA